MQKVFCYNLYRFVFFPIKRKDRKTRNDNIFGLFFLLCMLGKEYALHGRKNKPKIVSFCVILPFLLKSKKMQHDQKDQACFLVPKPYVFHCKSPCLPSSTHHCFRFLFSLRMCGFFAHRSSPPLFPRPAA